ncbi:hypothetical protein PAXRUDRAFT_167437 [Paxillus rubicundulus Ve08.2h10]|uniref:Uncharacterized protein n=1 Tax=Paxillus rubicundulus Ve08.2h10 TaxID=930991 RepID=A0A0D0C231_9AGAM|nr:hypothetical protein PAXRUDRAFT_167437 [Paxillus rubicundulus Ve08.2h10]
MAAQHHADTIHDPGGSMKAPGSHPLSIGMKGDEVKQCGIMMECPWRLGSNGKERIIEQDNNQGDLTTPRGPVGMPDSDMHCPNEPTEGHRDNKPGGRGVKGDKSGQVEGKTEEQSEGKDGQVLRPPSPLPIATP